MRQDLDQASVTPLELFFDLVFVFALTQVTAFMADEVSWHGTLRGVLVIMLLWWAWTGYAWLANAASAEERPIKLAILAGMVAMFILALCIPEAFDDLPGGLGTRGTGRVLPGLSGHASRHVHDPFSRGCRAAQTSAAVRDHRHREQRAAAGGVAVRGMAADGLVDAGAARRLRGHRTGGFRGWRLPAPGHFAERHGLIIIVALGESIVAIGVVAQEAVSWAIVAGSVLGLILSSALWWAYFDVSALLGEHALTTEPADPGTAGA